MREAVMDIAYSSEGFSLLGDGSELGTYAHLRVIVATSLIVLCSIFFEGFSNMFPLGTITRSI